MRLYKTRFSRTQDAHVDAKNQSGKEMQHVSSLENGSLMGNTLPITFGLKKELLEKMIEFEGENYLIISEFPEITWAYRELGNEHVEVLSSFCGCTVLYKCHIPVMKIIIAHREGKL